MLAEARAAFPDMGWACWDAHPLNPFSDHPLGKACDIVFGNQLGALAHTRADGAGLANRYWLQIYAAELHVSYVTFGGQIWTRADRNWRPYTSSIYDLTTPTGSHADDVHASTLAN